MKMLKLMSDGDSVVLGSSISLIKVIHRQGTEYYMANQNTDINMDQGWTMLSNGNGVVPMTVGNVISENVENEIRQALKAGLDSMGVCSKQQLIPNSFNKNNQCFNNLNVSSKLDVIAENENNKRLVSVYSLYPGLEAQACQQATKDSSIVVAGSFLTAMRYRYTQVLWCNGHGVFPPADCSFPSQH